MTKQEQIEKLMLDIPQTIVAKRPASERKHRRGFNGVEK